MITITGVYEFALVCVTFVSRSGNFDPSPPKLSGLPKSYIGPLIWSCQRLLLTVGVKFSWLNTCLSACSNVQRNKERRGSKQSTWAVAGYYLHRLHCTRFSITVPLIITACTEVLTIYRPRLFCGHSRYLRQSQSQNNKTKTNCLLECEITQVVHPRHVFHFCK